MLASAVAFIGIGGYGFSMAGGDPTDAGGNRLPSVVAPTGKCVISYTVWWDNGAEFKASVSVANRNTTPIKSWKLWILMPGDQKLSGRGKVHVTQQESAVVVSTNKSLLPQATQTMQMTGQYKESNATPEVFRLDGQTCETYVSGKPGEPSQPIQHLSDGSTRIGPAPTAGTPIPGLSTGPSGVVVVPISLPPTTPPPTDHKGLPPTDIPFTASPVTSPPTTPGKPPDPVGDDTPLGNQIPTATAEPTTEAPTATDSQTVSSEDGQPS